MPTAVSPIVITREIDISYVAPAVSTTIVGLVGGATRGPVNDPQYITSPQQFIETFGEPTTSAYLGYASILYLQAGNQLWVNRVAAQDGDDPYATATTDTAAALDSVIALAPGADITALNGKRLKLRFDSDTSKEVEILFVTDGSTTLLQICSQISIACETGFTPKLGSAGLKTGSTTLITITSQSRTGLTSAIEVIPPSMGDCATNFGWTSGATSTVGTKTVRAVVPNANAAVTGSNAVGAGYNFTVTAALIMGNANIQNLNIYNKKLALDIDSKGQIEMSFATYSTHWDPAQIYTVINNYLLGDARYGSSYATFADATNPSITGHDPVVNFNYSGGAGTEASFLMTIGSTGPFTVASDSWNPANITTLVSGLNSRLAIAYAAAGGTIPLTGSEFARFGVTDKVVISSSQGFTLALGGGSALDWLAILDPNIEPEITPRTVAPRTVLYVEGSDDNSNWDYTAGTVGFTMTIGTSATLTLTGTVAYGSRADMVADLNTQLQAQLAATAYTGTPTGTVFSLSGARIVIASKLGFTLTAGPAGGSAGDWLAVLDPGVVPSITPRTYSSYLNLTSPLFGRENSSILVSYGTVVSDLGLTPYNGVTTYGTGDNDLTFEVNGTEYSATLQGSATALGTAYIYNGTSGLDGSTVTTHSFSITIGSHAAFTVLPTPGVYADATAVAAELNTKVNAGYGSAINIFSASAGGAGAYVIINSTAAGPGGTPLFVQITDGTPSLLTLWKLDVVGSTIWQLTHAPYSIPYTTIIPNATNDKVKIIDPTSPVIGTNSTIEITDANTVLGFTAATTTGTDTEIGSVTFNATSPGTWANSTIDVKVYPENPLFNPVNAQKIEIYFNDALVETYRQCVLNPDGMTTDSGATYDETKFIETQINDVSDFITVDFDETLVGGADLDKLHIKPTNSSTGAVLLTPYTLAGGLDGLDNLSSNEIIGTAGTIPTGLQVFTNIETIFLNLIAAPGFSVSAVCNELIRIAEYRQDVLALIDPPFGLEPSEVVDWHNGLGGHGNTSAFNSSYAALYSTWIQYYDAYNDADIWLPPSCFMLAVIANSDNKSDPWFAPAGLSRGLVRSALDIEYNPTFGERELMYGNGNAVNPIVNFPQDGIVVWGQRTLQRIPSALDRINVRRMLLVARTIVRLAARVMLFEPNDSQTRQGLIKVITPLLKDIANRRGIQKFSVVDATSARDISLNQMVIKIFLQPTQSAEIIDIPFIITSAGVA